MKKLSILFVAASMLMIAGCGAGDSTSKAEEEAFKNHGKGSSVTPPADAMKAPTDFKSSIDSKQGPPTK